ncbi:MAG: hypothetical protein AAF492_11960 [Verrucomicrobiota bacterium]
MTCGLTGFSQNARVKVESISESRYVATSPGASFERPSFCRIRLTHFAPVLGPETRLVGIRFTRAVDSTGKNLIREREVPFKSAEAQKAVEGTFTADFSLQVSARAAESIAALEGALVLHTAREGAAKQVVVKDYMNYPGMFFEHPLFEQAGVKVAYIDAATFEPDGARCLEETIKGGGDARISDVDYVRQLKTLKRTLEHPRTLMLAVSDPGRKIDALQTVDEAGDVLNVYQPSSRGVWSGFDVSGNLKAPSLRIVLRTRMVETEVPFSLKDISLP